MLAAFIQCEEEFEHSPISRLRSLSDNHESPNFKIPGYEILWEIFRGGQGVVYQAIQLSTQRKVAVKVLLDGPFAGETSRLRFQREIKVVSLLRHPAIVPVFDSGIAQDRHYFVMDYIEGKRLNDYVHEHGLSTKAILKIFVTICEGINYAHQNGILHRDIKPSNILVDAEGKPHILDFGLAKHFGGDDPSEDPTIQLSMTGQIMGTLSYMSPEHASGHPEEVDIRSDVYSLGVILYELLSQSLPYELNASLGDNLSTIRNVPPKKLAIRDGTTPRDLSAIVLKTLNKEKSRRYQTAGAFGDDIGCFLRNDPIEAKRDNAVYLLRKMLRRHIAATFVGALFLFVVLTAAVVSSWLYSRAEDAYQKREVVLVQYQNERDKAREIGDRSRRRLYVAEMNLAGEAANHLGGIQRIRDFTKKWHPDVAGLDLRGWEWYFLRSLCDREQRTLTLEADQFSCSYSRDGRWLAVGGMSFVRVVDSQTGKVHRKFPGVQATFSIAWSPDGRRLAAGDANHEFHVWNIAQNKKIFSQKTREYVKGLCWNSDGTQLAVGVRSGEIHIWDMDSGEKQHTITQRRRLLSLDWHPRNPQLAVGLANGKILIINTDSGKIIQNKSLGNPPLESLSWSPDGMSLACGFANGALQVISAADLSENWASQQRGYFQSVQWSPDGKRIVAGGQFRNLRIYDANSGKLLQQLQGHTDKVKAVDWSPNGKTIVSVGFDRTVRFWPTNPDGFNRILCSLSNRRYGVLDFSPDGRMLAVGGPLAAVSIIDVATGETRQTLKGHKIRCNGLEWSPDGTMVASSAHDDNLIVWNVESGEEVGRLKSTDSIIDPNTPHSLTGFSWSRDGQQLIFCGRNPSVVLWDWKTRQIKTKINHATPITDDVDWHPVKSLVAAAGHWGGIRVWDPRQKEFLLDFKAHEHQIPRIRFSQKGNRLATASHDGTAKIWDANTGKLLQTCRGHVGHVLGLCWMPGGSRWATCSEDGTIKIWSANSETEILTIDVSKSPVRFIAWSPDGLKIASLDDEGHVRVWDASHAYRERGLAQPSSSRLNANPSD